MEQFVLGAGIVCLLISIVLAYVAQSEMTKAKAYMVEATKTYERINAKLRHLDSITFKDGSVVKFKGDGEVFENKSKLGMDWE